MQKIVNRDALAEAQDSLQRARQARLFDTRKARAVWLNQARLDRLDAMGRLNHADCHAIMNGRK